MIGRLKAWTGTEVGWRPLSRIRKRILRAVIAAMRPHEHGFDQPIDEDVLREVESSLRHLPARQRICLVGYLYFVEYGPPIYARRLRRFSKMTPSEGQKYLASWERRRWPRGGLLRHIRALVFLSFYQHPDILAALKIGWADRAVTLSRLHAELVHDRPVGDFGAR